MASLIARVSLGTAQGIEEVLSETWSNTASPYLRTLSTATIVHPVSDYRECPANPEALMW